MVEECEWLTNDASKETDGAVDALASLLEIPEASELQSTQLNICRTKLKQHQFCRFSLTYHRQQKANTKLEQEY